MNMAPLDTFGSMIYDDLCTFIFQRFAIAMLIYAQDEGIAQRANPEYEGMGHTRGQTQQLSTHWKIPRPHGTIKHTSIY